MPAPKKQPAKPDLAGKLLAEMKNEDPGTIVFIRTPHGLHNLCTVGELRSACVAAKKKTVKP